MASAGPFSYTLGGLTCGATYHYQAIASGPGGTAQGIDKTFIAPETAACLEGAVESTTATAAGGATLGGGGATGTPVVTTDAITASTGSAGSTGSATVNGTATYAAGFPVGTNVSFDFGPDTTYVWGYNPPNTPTTAVTTYGFSVPYGGLTCGSTYHYRAKAVSASLGTIYGLDRTFTACAPAPHPGDIITGSTGGIQAANTGAAEEEASIPVDGGIPLTADLKQSVTDYFQEVFGTTSTASALSTNLSSVSARQSIVKPSIVLTANGGPTAAVSSGDTVDLAWSAENIQANTCIGYDDNTAQKNWEKTVKQPLKPMQPNTVTTYAEVSAPVSLPTTEFILRGCTGTDGTVLPDQSVTVTIGEGSGGQLSSSKVSKTSSASVSAAAKRLSWTDTGN